MQPYEKQLQWLATMARHPGFRDYARARAQELHVDPEHRSGLFQGIYKDVQALLKADGQAPVTACVSPMKEKLP